MFHTELQKDRIDFHTSWTVPELATGLTRILDSATIPTNKRQTEQVETRNPYQPPCFHALFHIQPQPRDRRAPSLIGLRAL